MVYSWNKSDRQTHPMCLRDKHSGCALVFNRENHIGFVVYPLLLINFQRIYYVHAYGYWWTEGYNESVPWLPVSTNVHVFVLLHCMSDPVKIVRERGVSKLNNPKLKFHMLGRLQILVVFDGTKIVNAHVLWHFLQSQMRMCVIQM